MKDQRTEWIAIELIKAIDQWFAKRKSPENRHDWAEQCASGIKPEQKRSEAPESLTWDAMHDLELTMIAMKVNLAVLKKSPDGENQQQHLVILAIQVSQLHRVLAHLQALLQLEDPH